MSTPITVAILGCGNRGGWAYANIITSIPDEMKVVALADVRKDRLEKIAKQNNVPKEMCFNSAEEFFAQPKLADILCVCTQDKQHFGHAIPALEKGYHLILEKPISPNPEECKKIAEVANKYNRYVFVCHVLRYTPFYSKVKKIIDSGVLGDLVTVNAEEQVGYFHQAHSFIRGNWRRKDETSPMILAKCCHDMDLLLWLTGKKCKKISSFGSLKYFKEENAPAGSAEMCFNCNPETKAKCPYDAEKIYLTGPRGAMTEYGKFPVRTIHVDPTPENIKKVLTDGPFGRCVFHCDNDVVDHQVVNLLLEDDVTVNFTMSAFSKKIKRTIIVRGTMGELIGDMEKNLITVNLFDESTEPTVYDVSNELDDFRGNVGHGGGDSKMVKLISKFMRKVPDVDYSGITTIDQSVASHFVALAAEDSRLNDGKVIDLDEWVAKI